MNGPKKIVYSVVIKPDTRRKLAEIARANYRGIGPTIDQLVAEAWVKLQQADGRNS